MQKKVLTLVGGRLTDPGHEVFSSISSNLARGLVPEVGEGLNMPSLNRITLRACRTIPTKTVQMRQSDFDRTDIKSRT